MPKAQIAEFVSISWFLLLMKQTKSHKTMQ